MPDVVEQSSEPQVLDVMLPQSEMVFADRIRNSRHDTKDAQTMGKPGMSGIRIVVHSHPQGCATCPSTLDDEMDLYCASLYGARPYLSLIFSWNAGGDLQFSGRAYDRGRWMPVVTLLSPGDTLGRWESGIVEQPVESDDRGEDGERRNERLFGLIGQRSARRVAAARIGIVGCSGTGSPALELAIRAGFKHLVAVDPEREAYSNLERMHGSKAEDFISGRVPPYKVESMQRMAKEIDPSAEITSIVGNFLDDVVLDQLLRCDVVLNATDTHHSRAFLSHLATHYLVPCFDVGVAMDGERGKVTLQNIEITRFWPGDPCAFCRRKIVPNILSWELMADEERVARQEAAKIAAAEGGKPDMYWGGRPRQLHTVGYLTTMAGSLAMGYIVGAVTGTFKMPHQRFQFDPSVERFGFAPYAEESRVAECQCGKYVGFADAALHARTVGRPAHWPRAMLLFPLS